MFRIVFYPLYRLINAVRDLHERKFITDETKEEQMKRRANEVWDSDTRFIYTKHEGGKWHRGELGQFDLWGEVVHKYTSMVTEAGVRYDGHIKTRVDNYMTKEKFEEIWEIAK